MGAPESLPQDNVLYRFGPFEADLARGELRKHGKRIRLEAKPWQVLLHLVKRPGGLVTRGEIHHSLWGNNVFVDFENGLNVAINKLRTALGDSKDNPSYIETISGEGYRFVAVVEAVSKRTDRPLALPALAAGDEKQTLSPGHLLRPRTSTRPSRRWILIIAIMLGALGLSIRRVETSAPANPINVLMGAFENDTGDPVLDGTLHFALERELSNSGVVRVISPERLRDILALMRHPPVAELDRGLALDISRRTPGVRAIVMARAQKSGPVYLLTAEVIDPTDGTMLRAEESRAAKQGEILGAIDSLSTQLRRDVLDSVAASHADLPPLEPVTTRSLRALQLYSEANDLMIRHDEDLEGSMELLRQALAEDPDFASAHIMLAWQLVNSNLPATEHFERALALSTTASERERLFITGSYYEEKIASPGDAATQKAIAAYEELLRHYPDDYWAMHSLSGLYRGINRTREALLLGVRKAESRPENTEQNLADLWSRLEQIGETGAADRLIGLCTRRLDIPKCAELLVFRDFLPVWHAIRLGQPEEALRLAHAVRDRYPAAGFPGNEFVRTNLNDVYLDLGMFAQDLELAKDSADLDFRLQAPALIAYYRGDREGENAASSELAKHLDFLGPASVMRFADLGRFHDAHLAIEANRKSWPLQAVHLARGYVEFKQGNLAASLRDIGEGDSYYKEQRFSAISKTSEQLAVALERVNRKKEARQVLEQAESQLTDQGEHDFVDSWNLITREHLARLYREGGQVAEAARIEAELSAQLKLSEPDSIVLQALNDPSRHPSVSGGFRH